MTINLNGNKKTHQNHSYSYENSSSSNILSRKEYKLTLRKEKMRSIVNTSSSSLKLSIHSYLNALNNQIKSINSIDLIDQRDIEVIYIFTSLIYDSLSLNRIFDPISNKINNQEKHLLFQDLIGKVNFEKEFFKKLYEIISNCYIYMMKIYNKIDNSQFFHFHIFNIRVYCIFSLLCVMSEEYNSLTEDSIFYSMSSIILSENSQEYIIRHSFGSLKVVYLYIYLINRILILFSLKKIENLCFSFDILVNSMNICNKINKNVCKSKNNEHLLVYKCNNICILGIYSLYDRIIYENFIYEKKNKKKFTFFHENILTIISNSITNIMNSSFIPSQIISRYENNIKENNLSTINFIENINLNLKVINNSIENSYLINKFFMTSTCHKNFLIFLYNFLLYIIENKNNVGFSCLYETFYEFLTFIKLNILVLTSNLSFTLSEESLFDGNEYYFVMMVNLIEKVNLELENEIFEDNFIIKILNLNELCQSINKSLDV